MRAFCEKQRSNNEESLREDAIREESIEERKRERKEGRRKKGEQFSGSLVRISHFPSMLSILLVCDVKRCTVQVRVLQARNINI